MLNSLVNPLCKIILLVTNINIIVDEHINILKNYSIFFPFIKTRILLKMMFKIYCSGKHLHNITKRIKDFAVIQNNNSLNLLYLLILLLIVLLLYSTKKYSKTS